VHIARLFALGRFDDHPAADDVAVIGPIQVDPQPMIPRVIDIAQNDQGFIDMADHQVDAAVVVQITISHAARTMNFLEKRPTFLRTDAKTKRFLTTVVKDDRVLETQTLVGEIVEYLAVDFDDVLPAAILDIDKRRAPTDVVVADGQQSR